MLAIIENQPGLIWLKDINSNFLFVRAEFSKSCGLDNPSFLVFGKSDFDIWPRELANKYIEFDKMVIQSKEPNKVEEQFIHKGVLKWFEAFKTPVFDDKGIVIGTTGFSHDFTKPKQYTCFLRKKQMK